MSSGGQEEVPKIVETVAAMGGAAGGTALTFLAGPFVGSVAGELISRTLLVSWSAVDKHILEPRRHRRLDAAFAGAAEASRERLEAGDVPRDDEFFQPRDSDGQIPADEIAEGALQTAADQWESRKAPYIGRLLANITFDATVSPEEASYLVRLADRLSYEQFCLLDIWSDITNRKALSGFALPLYSEQGGRFDDDRQPASLIYEIGELNELRLLGVENSDGKVVPRQATVGGLGGTLYDVAPDVFRLTSAGRRFHDLLDLGLIPSRDTDRIIQAVVTKSARYRDSRK